MKTWSDVCTRLRNELVHWHTQQVEYPMERFYLCFTPWTHEHNSGLLIVRNCPNDYTLVTPEHMHRNMTVEQNYNKLLPLLRRLPVLDQQ